MEHECDGLRNFNNTDTYQHTSIKGNVMESDNVDHSYMEFEIFYCPWCGKKLESEDKK